MTAARDDTCTRTDLTTICVTHGYIGYKLPYTSNILYVGVPNPIFQRFIESLYLKNIIVALK